MTLLDPELAARAIERALARGGDLGELYAEDRRGFGVALDDGRIERPQAGAERGASVRVVDGDATYFGHVDGIAEDDLLRVADSVAQAVRGGDPRPVALQPPSRSHGTRSTSAPRTSTRRQGRHPARLRRARPRRRRSECPGQRLYAESRQRIEVYNSDGVAAADDRTRVRLGVQVVARRNGTVETGHETRGGHAGFELIADDPEAVADEAARKALTMLDAVDAPTGQMPVVVGPGFGGVLLHEAVGHGLEADAIQKRASVYAGRLGDKLADAFVTAYDDGRRQNEWGSDGIDDEGTPTQQHDDHRERHADLVPVRPAARAEGRRRLDRQRPPRIVPPPPGPAHDQHVLRARRRHAATSSSRASSAASTRSRSAAARSSRRPATSSSASPRAT